MTPVGILLTIVYIIHKKIESTRNAMDWLRMKVGERILRMRIRAQEKARTGIYLDSEGKKDSAEENFELKEEST